MTAASIRQDDPDYFPMWSGQNVGLIHDLPGAGEVVEAVIREARATPGDPRDRSAAMRRAALAILLLGATACAPPPPRTAALALPATQTTITREQAQATLAAARGLIEKGAQTDARARLAGVIPDAERWGWLDIASDAHYLIGETFDRQRNPRDAADEYTRAYDASRRLGDQARGVRTLNALTNTLLDAGALDKATEAATEADRLARRENDLSAQATAQNNLAEANRLAGRLLVARDGYERALSLARQASDRVAMASILMNLGTAERRSGRLAQARSRFVEARDLARALEDQRAGTYAEWNLEEIETEIRRQGDNR